MTCPVLNGISSDRLSLAGEAKVKIYEIVSLISMQSINKD